MKTQRSNPVYSRVIQKASLLLLCASIAGCGADITAPINGGGPSQSFKSLSGNWQIAVTASVGPAPFAQLSGYIDERNTGTAAGFPVTAALQLTDPSACYSGALLVPASGQVLKDQLGLYSFTINGQYFDTTSTVNAASTSFSGTYVVEDGCAGSLSSSGSLVGTHYADLTGDFAGSLSGIEDSRITVDLTQVSAGNSDGTFDISGTMHLDGLACYSQSPLASVSGSVIGGSVQLAFSDPPTGSRITVAGTFDPTAHALSLNSVNISGGSCAGSLGPAALTRQ